MWATGKLLSRGAWAAALHPRLRQLVPSAAGLALIPLLVPHIDEAVTGWMDQHLRPRLPQQVGMPARRGLHAGFPEGRGMHGGAAVLQSPRYDRQREQLPPGVRLVWPDPTPAERCWPGSLMLQEATAASPNDAHREALPQ